MFKGGLWALMASQLRTTALYDTTRRHVPCVTSAEDLATPEGERPSLTPAGDCILVDDVIVLFVKFVRLLINSLLGVWGREGLKTMHCL